jgi:hypothetical protein
MRHTNLTQQAIILAILLALDFTAYADTQPYESSVTNQTALTKPEKPKANNGQQTLSNQKRASLKTKSGFNKKSALNAEKKKEAQTVAYLKANQQCDSWFDLDGNTSDEKAYEQIKNTGYTKANAPEAVKKQIAEGVEKCNKKYLVTNTEKPKVQDNDNSSLQADQSTEKVSKDQPEGFFGKVSNGVAQFFENLKNRNKRDPNHACSSGELLMHTNGC